MKYSKYASLAAILTCATQAHSQVLITGIIDGPRTGGLPKGVELYVTQDIADLSIIGIESGTNGAASTASEFSLSGSATAGTFITVASESPGWTAYFGTAPSFTTSVLGINGNDPIYLWINGTVVDAFGGATNPAVDTSYNYQDTWWYRNTGTTASVSWTSANWTSAPGQSDALDTLGTSGTNPAFGDPLHMPLGSYSAIPEPSAAAALFGALALAGVVTSRRRRTVSAA